MKPERKMFAPGGLKLDDQGYIEAAFAQLDVVDHDGDITRPGAFPQKSVPMSAYGHTSWDGALPVGKGDIVEEDGWAVFKGQFFMDTTHGRDAFVTVKGLGDLAEYSYGYNVTDGGPSTVGGKSVNEIRALEVWEVSPVLRGAGIGTHTLAIKSDGPDPAMSFAEHLDWTLDQVKALLERAKSRKALRESEGRDLSTDNTDRLAELLDDLKALLPTPEPVKARDNTLEVEIERARALGVLITASNE